MDTQQPRKMVDLSTYGLLNLQNGRYALVKNGQPVFCPHSSPVAVSKDNLSLGAARAAKDSIDTTETRICNTGCPFAVLCSLTPLEGETEVPQIYTIRCGVNRQDFQCGMAKISIPSTDSNLKL